MTDSFDLLSLPSMDRNDPLSPVEPEPPPEFIYSGKVFRTIRCIDGCNKCYFHSTCPSDAPLVKCRTHVIFVAVTND